jgi:hypothetical protein
MFIAGSTFAQTEDAQMEPKTEVQAEPQIEAEATPQPEAVQPEVAQTDTKAAQTGDKTPKNTITVDFGPTIMGAAFKAVGGMVGGGEEGLSSSGFGIGVQYERQLLDRVTAGGKFTYLGSGIGISQDEEGLKASAELKLSSFSLEGHARYYPFAKRTFFLDGMLGYANMSMGFSGELIVTDDDTHKKEKESVGFAISRNFFMLGAKLGWRNDFGKPGGFIFEPSFGYYYGLGLGNTFGDQLSKKLKADIGDNFDFVFKVLENVIFVGGPRLSLAFGWRF